MTRSYRLSVVVSALALCVTVGVSVPASAVPFTGSSGSPGPGPSAPPAQGTPDHVFGIGWIFKADPGRTVVYGIAIKQFSTRCVENVSPTQVDFTVSVAAGAVSELRDQIFGYDTTCLPFITKNARWQITTTRDTGRGPVLVDDMFVDFTDGDELTWDQETYEDKDPVVLDRIPNGLQLVVHARNPR